tara:strand:+ start:3036 stop:3911 length:876 start_codon:yes stop_codon:yes gene_type:complete
MYPNRFDYYQANTLSELFDLMSENGDGMVEYLAGGHSLIPMMKTGLAAPDVLIDLKNIDELRGIEQNDTTTCIGAMECYADISKSPIVKTNCPVLAEAVGLVGDIQVRNRGTLGGNLAHNDPASDPPAAILASQATLHVQGPNGKRIIQQDDFFTGLYETSLEEDEILTKIEVKNIGEGVGAYLKKPSPSSGYAMIGTAVVLHTKNGTIEDARVAVIGAVDHATRLNGVEDALIGSPATHESAITAAEHALEGIEDYMVMEDLQASAEYREHLIKVHAKRATMAAIDNLKN